MCALRSAGAYAYVSRPSPPLAASENRPSAIIIVCKLSPLLLPSLLLFRVSGSDCMQDAPASSCGDKCAGESFQALLPLPQWLQFCRRQRSFNATCINTVEYK